MTRNNFLLSVIILFCGCTGPTRLNKIDYSPLYRTHNCNPQFKIYHVSQDSSLFYFTFNNNDLLFKKNESGVFEGVISVNYCLYTSTHKPEIIDSSSIVYRIAYDSVGSGYTGITNFRAFSGNNYFLKITFTDVNRNQANIYSLRVNKTGLQSAQFFELLDAGDQVIISNYVQKNTKIKIVPPPALPGDSLAVRCYFRRFPLAPPPFSDVRLAAFEYTPDKTYYVQRSGLNQMSFEREGFYHLQFDTVTKDGLTIYCFDDDFPVFTKSEQLIEALRYLCTREEYNDLLQKADKKKAIDDFWLTKAGNNERGRKLIRVYYNRSIEANKLFTSYLEGWKTDRGMLYIIFGPPQSVYRDIKYEIWRYSVSEGIPDVQFIFDKVNNPFSENDFELERSINYQNIWYQAVDAWRSGRIVGEY